MAKINRSGAPREAKFTYRPQPIVKVEAEGVLVSAECPGNWTFRQESAFADVTFNLYLTCSQTEQLVNWSRNNIGVSRRFKITIEEAE